MKDGWKEFHLVAEPVKREIAPGMSANLWGYNGQSPGPTPRVRRGRSRARLRHQQAAGAHDDHWHGVLVPNGMDGVGGLNQPHIPPGKTFVYVPDDESERSCTTARGRERCRWRWD